MTSTPRPQGLRRFVRVVSVILVSLLLRSVPALAEASQDEPDVAQAPAGKAPSAEQLSSQANNPNTLLTQLQLRNITAPRLPGFDGTGNTLQLQAIIPVKAHEITPFPILMKLVVPIITLPQPVEQTGLGPTQYFAQGVFHESWGSWGAGFTLSAPTETFRGLPKQTWQVGPAAAIIYTGINNLILGGVFQNPITVYTPSGSTSSNALTFTPTITFTLPGGWFAGYADFDWTVNWKAHGDVTFPVGVQFGKIIHIGRQPFSVSFETGYNVIRPSNDAGVPRWMFGFEFSALFPAL